MAVLVARLALVGVFLLAGIAKLGDREGVRRMVVELGAPARVAPPLTWLLVGCELAVAAALAIGTSARIGAIAAAALLLAFGVGIAVGLGRGRRPQCHCFGRFRANEVGWSTVARNALLATIAGYAAANGRFAVVFGVIAAAAAWATLAARRSGALRRGATAPALSLPDQTGRLSTLESLRAGDRPVLLVFGDPSCGACTELFPALAGWQRRAGPGPTVALVSGGSDSENALLASRFGLWVVLTDQDRATTAAYGISATPSAVLVDAQRRITGKPAVGAEEISQLFAREHQPTLDRRAVVSRAATGVAAVALAPLIESVAAAAQTAKRALRPKQLKIDGAWLCDQRYALCTFAACRPSKTNKHISVCRCKVKTGYSVGFKTCKRRAPSGRQLHSNFSLQDVTNRTRALKCSQRGLWVQCLDVVCEVDRHDPKHALCQCVNQHTKNFFTFAGNCDQKTCQTVIWSATTAPFPGGAQYEKGLKRLGIPFKVPKSCPAPE